jgi:hypothetical protein
MSDTLEKPVLRVAKDGDKFRIVDAEDHFYGSYDSQSKADTNLRLWQEYFDAPLVF